MPVSLSKNRRVSRPLIKSNTVRSTKNPWYVTANQEANSVDKYIVKPQVSYEKQINKINGEKPKKYISVGNQLIKCDNTQTTSEKEMLKKIIKDKSPYKKVFKFFSNYVKRMNEDENKSPTFWDKLKD
jgi:hypothetical protein